MNMPANQQNRALTLRQALTAPNITARIEQRLGEKAGAFITSILDLAGETKLLAECNPNDVIKEGLKAASLDLPINKNLGFAYVIPYNESSKINGQWVKKMMPHFQMGYKGFLQLAIRTGQYKYLNAGVVYEGEEMIVNRIHGTLDIAGKATSDKPIGYFAYMQLINGFEKAIGWSVEKVMAHGKKYSKSFGGKYPEKSLWVTDPEAMALKTMILQLVPKYGPMTIEMTQALTNDRADVPSFDQAETQIEAHANQGEVIDVDTTPAKDAGPEPMTDNEKAEILAQESGAEELGPQSSGPDF